MKIKIFATCRDDPWLPSFRSGLTHRPVFEICALINSRRMCLLLPPHNPNLPPPSSTPCVLPPPLWTHGRLCATTAHHHPLSLCTRHRALRPCPCTPPLPCCCRAPPSLLSCCAAATTLRAASARRYSVPTCHHVATVYGEEDTQVMNLQHFGLSYSTF